MAMRESGEVFAHRAQLRSYREGLLSFCSARLSRGGDFSLVAVACMPAVFLSGCTSTESLIQSSIVGEKNACLGTLYYSPRQLIKVSYTRKELEQTAASAKFNASKEKLAGLNKSIEEMEAKIKEASAPTLFYDQDQAASVKALSDQQIVIAHLNAQLKALKAAKPAAEKDLAQASIDNVNAKGTVNPFSEQLVISPEPTTADTRNAFCATVDHSGNHSDTSELKLKDGLLDGAIGQSDDKTSDIAVSLASTIAGVTGGGLVTSYAMKLDRGFSSASGCNKLPAVSVAQVIDPLESSEVDVLNAALKQGCIKLKIKSTIAQDKINKPTSTQQGLIYQSPGSIKISVYDTIEEKQVNTVTLMIAQAGYFGVAPLPKARFAKNEYDIAFANGSLVKNKVTQPSETLGVAMIVPNMIKGAFALPTELIQLKVNYSTSDAALAEQQKAKLAALVEIEKKQLELEKLKAEAVAE